MEYQLREESRKAHQLELEKEDAHNKLKRE